MRAASPEGGGTEPRPQPFPKFMNPFAPQSHAPCRQAARLQPEGRVDALGSRETSATGPRKLRGGRRRNLKCEGSAARGREFAQRGHHVTHRPLPAAEEDVAGVRGVPGLGAALGEDPRGPGLRWGQGRLLHSGPESRTPHARVLLLRGSSGPGGPGAGLPSAPAGGGGPEGWAGSQVSGPRSAELGERAGNAHEVWSPSFSLTHVAARPAPPVLSQPSATSPEPPRLL